MKAVRRAPRHNIAGGVMNRRTSVSRMVQAAMGLAVFPLTAIAQAAAKLSKTKTEWKTLLPQPNYAVLFEEDTERAGSSPLNHEKRAGTYVCFACALPLFKSDMKFDSGTGWPSFFTALPGALGTNRDFKLVWPRTEYHCARCGGHQGHLFDDGPQPTGKRYCNNGVSLRFIPTNEPLPELRT
jgi:peptide-methionine (R)-S-oxide reductase